MPNKNSKKLIVALLKNDLAGNIITILKHSDKNLINISGEIVEETKSTIILRTAEKEIRVEKKAGKFQFIINQERVLFDGELLQGLAKRRAKRKLRDW